MGRELPKPAVLAGIDPALHRERAVCALALYFSSDFKASPTVWEERARAALAQLERYGVIPVWLFDPVFLEEAKQALARKLGRGEAISAVDVEAAGLPVAFFHVVTGDAGSGA